MQDAYTTNKHFTSKFYRTLPKGPGGKNDSGPHAADQRSLETRSLRCTYSAIRDQHRYKLPILLGVRQRSSVQTKYLGPSVIRLQQAHTLQSVYYARGARRPQTTVWWWLGGTHVGVLLVRQLDVCTTAVKFKTWTTREVEHFTIDIPDFWHHQVARVQSSMAHAFGKFDSRKGDWRPRIRGLLSSDLCQHTPGKLMFRESWLCEVD